MEISEDTYPNIVEETVQGKVPPPRQSNSKALIVLVVGLTIVAMLTGFFLGQLSSEPPLYDENLGTALFETISPAVVEITITRGNDATRATGLGTGSGFIVDSDGHIITNNHVVSGEGEIKVRLSDGRTLDATKLGFSPADDLALLQVNPDEISDIEPLVLADSDALKPGQLAVAIGSPFRNFNSVNVGVVSGTGRGPTSPLQRPIPNMIQTDVPLNPGNSGGPLLNSSGEVIGVNSAVVVPTSQQIDDFRIGFAVPSNTIKNLMPDLLVKKELRRPWLGISSRSDLNAQLLENADIPTGIVVTQVFQDSPAQEAGLIPFRTIASRGDIITAVDGISVGGVDDMVSYFNSLRPGDIVTLSVKRIDNLGVDEDLEIDVTLAPWPET